jgi:hypothetical protein
METKKIEDLKKGEFFKLKPDSSVVYVRGIYIRETKRYESSKFDDINSFTYKKKGTIVYVGFDF